MTRRTIVAALWFIAVAIGCDVLWSLGVTPRPLGVVVATAVAGFIWLDPLREFHPRPETASQPVVSSRESQLVPR